MDGSHEAARYGATSRFHTRGQIDRGHRIDVTRVRRALDDSGVTRVNPADVFSDIFVCSFLNVDRSVAFLRRIRSKSLRAKLFEMFGYQTSTSIPFVSERIFVAYRSMENGKV